MSRKKAAQPALTGTSHPFFAHWDLNRNNFYTSILLHSYTIVGGRLSGTDAEEFARVFYLGAGLFDEGLEVDFRQFDALFLEYSPADVVG